MDSFFDDNWYEIYKHCKEWHHILYNVSKNLRKIVIKFIAPIHGNFHLLSL